MFIFFGVRASKLNTAYRLQGATCPYCHVPDSFLAQVSGHYFHAFFIPVFPLWKSTVAECSHCRKTYDGNQFTPAMRVSLAQQQIVRPAKRPWWHWIGSMIVGGLILFLVTMFIVLVAVTVRRVNQGETEQARYAEMLRSDLAKTVSKPRREKDSISLYLKWAMDAELTDDLDKNAIKYYSRVQDGKLLVLVKVDDMKKIPRESRKEIIGIIEGCIGRLQIPDADEIYIGVHGRWNMVLVSTPQGSDLSGDFADSKLLYPFYRETESDKTIPSDGTSVGNDSLTVEEKMHP